MPKMILLTIIALSVTAASAAVGPVFTKGVHLENRSDKAQEIRIGFGPGPLSTSICFVAEPTDGIKNGLAPAFLRNVPGFVKLGNDKNGVWAEVAANTRVSCVCATACVIENLAGKKVVSKNRSTVIIAKDGAMRVEKWQAAH